MTENFIVGKWIYERLTSSTVISDHGVSVFPVVAAQETRSPYILYQIAESRDVRGVGGVLFMANAEYQISLVVEAGTNMDTIRDVVEEIDRLFDVQYLDIFYDGLLIQGSHRTMQYEGNYPTDINNTKIMYASRYTIRARRMGV